MPGGQIASVDRCQTLAQSRAFNHTFNSPSGLRHHNSCFSDPRLAPFHTSIFAFSIFVISPFQGRMSLTSFTVLLALLGVSRSELCDRRLYEARGNRKLGHNGFTIEINSLNNRSDVEPSGFIPGDTYTSIGFYPRRVYHVLQLLFAVGAPSTPCRHFVASASPLSWTTTSRAENSMYLS